MVFHVELAPQADREIDQAYRWIAQASSTAAHRWFNGLMKALRSLGENPRRFPLAPENEAFEEEIRQLLHGRRHHRYRVLFTIRGATVQVLHVRHGAREFLAPGKEPPPDAL